MERKTTDFSIILTELHERGLNDYKMAEITGMTRTMLTKLRKKQRKQPNYDDGVAIMEVYEKEVKSRLD